MEAIETILTRCSTPKLTMPFPDEQSMEQVLRCALKAPDHGRLRPWRFLTITGSGLDRLGELFVEAALLDDPLLEKQKEEKLRAKPSRAPMVVVAVAEVVEGHKVPEWEQIVAVGAAVQNMQLALHSMGFGSMWRTGSMTSSRHVREGLGFSEKDSIVAFLYVGTPAQEPKASTPLAVKDYCQRWPR